MRRIGWGGALLWAALAGCDGGASAPPANPPADLEVAVPAGAGATPGGSEAVVKDEAGLVGWWRAPGVCIELFANGDFELSDPGDQPKVMVLGKATVTADGADRFTLALATARIWRGRFTGPCRKVHEFGGWMDARDMLGRIFKVGETTTLTARRVDARQLELCGERCATLTTDTPALGSRWRRADMDIPDRPQQPWQAGDLLELEIGAGRSGHVWAGVAGGKLATVYGAVEATYVAPDRFTLSITPAYYADAAEEGAPPRALGLAFPIGEARELTARRLAGERLEVCAGESCATLERQFDAYHHDLE